MIILIYGGESRENLISKKSALSVYNVLKKQGEVLMVEAYWNEIEKISFDQVDYVFLATHGGIGENGTLQKYLEDKGVAYTGASAQNSALLFNKWDMKKWWHQQGFQTPEGFLWSHREDIDVLAPFIFPCVLKPVEEGSSIDVHYIADQKKFDEFCQKYGDMHKESWLCERYIEGEEASVGFFYGDVLPILEIKREGPIFDTKQKYDRPLREKVSFPQDKEREELFDEIRGCVAQFCRAIELESFCRIDMILKDNSFFFIEANTIPGLTEGSLLPLMAERQGYSYEDFILKIVKGYS